MSDRKQRVALVIGNGKYKNAPVLVNPPNDASAMASALGRLGFSVNANFDLDIQGMESEIGKFHETVAEGCVALFYFAGHGMQVDGENYLVPVDAVIGKKAELARRTFCLSDELEKMRQKAIVSLIFLDACRDNPFSIVSPAAGDSIRGGVAPGPRLAELPAPNGAYVAFATEPGRFAKDGKGSQYSPFTGALLEYIEKPDLSVSDMMTKVKAAVVDRTRRVQRPWDQSSLSEPFFFKSTKPALRRTGREPIGEVSPQRTQLDSWCYKIRDAGAKALSQVQPVVEASPIRACAYTIKGRVKTKQNILEKVLRKRTAATRPKPDYQPSDVTDAAGLQVIVLFQQDILEVVSHILRMVQHHASVTDSPFVQNDLRQVSIFTNRPDNDPLSVARAAYNRIRTAGFDSVCLPPQVSQSGYSSVHFIVAAMVEMEDELGTPRPVAFPLEIQVRTVFEDAWGEIEHKVRYGSKGRDGGSGQDERLALHLNALKTFFDGCTQYTDIVKKHAIDPSADTGTAPHFSPIETVQQALKLFGDYPDGIQQKLRVAYAARERLANASNPQDTRQFAAETFEEFERLEKEEQHVLAAGDHKARKLRSYLKMEQAFALMRTGDEDSREAAIRIYRDMNDQSPQDPVILYRWGTALSSMSRFSEAIPVLESGLEALGGGGRQHLLDSALPRNLAFVYWRLSEAKVHQVPERLELLRKAYDFSIPAVQRAEPGTNLEALALNNLIYYIVEYDMVAEQAGRDLMKVERLGEYVDKLKDHLDRRLDGTEASNHFQTNIRSLDTLCRAYAKLKREDAALDVANRITGIMEKMNVTELGPDEFDILKFARSIQARFGKGRSLGASK